MRMTFSPFNFSPFTKLREKNSLKGDVHVCSQLSIFQLDVMSINISGHLVLMNWIIKSRPEGMLPRMRGAFNQLRCSDPVMTWLSLSRGLQNQHPQTGLKLLLNEYFVWPYELIIHEKQQRSHHWVMSRTLNLIAGVCYTNTTCLPNANSFPLISCLDCVPVLMKIFFPDHISCLWQLPLNEAEQDTFLVRDTLTGKLQMLLKNTASLSALSSISFLSLPSLTSVMDLTHAHSSQRHTVSPWWVAGYFPVFLLCHPALSQIRKCRSFVLLCLSVRKGLLWIPFDLQPVTEGGLQETESLFPL